MYYVYIIQSETTGKYYIGQTNNLLDRLTRHNSKQSKFTKNRGPWKLVYSEEYSTRNEALNRETQIKKMKSRKYIENLISLSG
ncbi:GIY-YIG nuclease family protein [Bacteroidetes/Chlorobi group bacterium ChocPot_Mid]|nr:MAG: GIY-YIG nuclease family protein [Bacteroidetes/Chlorobi group bacterium ChocPot_Mid]